MRQRLVRWAFLAAVLMLGTCLDARAATRYVDRNVPASGNGTSWANAFRTLGEAVAASAPDDEIWVARGTYAEGATLSVGEHTLYGGFAGTENARDERDWVANPTIISGEATQRIFSKTAAGTFTLDGFTLQDGKTTTGSVAGGSGAAIYATAGSLTLRNAIVTNCYAAYSGGAIYHGSNSDAANVFSNLTFAANTADNAAAKGGACHFDTGSHEVFTDCHFVGNQAPGVGGSAGGGAIYKGTTAAKANLLELTRCTFTGNAVPDCSTTSGGGAVWSLSRILARDCDFVGNSILQRFGGAVYAQNAHAHTFSNCTFVANTLGDGSTAGGGGALFVATAGSTLRLEACTFTGNAVTTLGSGGAVSSDGTGLFELTRCTFTSNAINTGIRGGGAIDSAGWLVARECDFIANSAYQRYGGAVYSRGVANHEFVNCAFIGNTLSGGSGAPNATGGGALFVTAGNPLISNCTFYKNEIGNNLVGGGGALHLYCGYGTAGNGNAIVINSIFRENVNAAGAAYGHDILRADWGPSANPHGSISYTSIEPPGVVYKPLVADSGVINVDPLFASTSVPYDIALKSPYGRWDASNQTWGARDGVLSPAIDIGDPASDYNLEPYHNGGRINLGRYGNTARASASAEPLVNIAVIETNTTDATVSGTLHSFGKAHEVRLYWGLMNGGSDPNLWESSAAAGSYDGDPTSALTGMATGLTLGMNYFATFRATTATASIWATNVLAFATPSVVGQPNIQILGANGIALGLGEAASAVKGTDFGVLITNLYVDHVFTVTNSAGATLELDGTPIVSISGDTADFFTNGTAVAANVEPGETSTIQIRFQPQAMGVRTALVSVANNVPGKHPYTFALRGIGDSGAAMRVRGIDGSEIADGAAPSLAAGTDFGTLMLGDAPVERVFTITNTGVRALALGSLEVGGAAPFTAVAPVPVSSVEPGGTTSFGLRLDPTAGGVLTARVSIANNVLDGSPYTINLSALVDIPPVPGVVYVRSDATALPEDGGSWRRAYRSLATAIAASPADAVFWVAAGIYNSGATLNVSTQTLYGGFVGNETALAQRDWETNATIITGAKARRIFSKAAGGTFTLDGFTLKDGKTTTANQTFGSGATIYCTAGSLTLRNCIVTHSDTAWYGAIFHSDADGGNLFSNVTFAANTARNTNNRGGACYFADGSHDEFVDCRFVGNQALGTGAAAGAAIFKGTTADKSNLLALTRCTFTDNSVPNGGATGGGGAVWSEARIVARECDFAGNLTAIRQGGAVVARNSHAHEFVNCAFVDNTLVNLDHRFAGGGALFVDTSSTAASIENCTFYKNTIVGGTPDEITGGGAVRASSAIVVRNSIFWDNTVPAVADGPDIRGGGTVDIAYALINSAIAGPVPAIVGDGMLDQDPRFVSETAPYDIHLRSRAGRWDPATAAWVLDTVNSPGIDAGDPASEYAREPSGNGGRINLGRYGNTPEASLSTVRPTTGLLLLVQ